jgi:hypothetical protein
MGEAQGRTGGLLAGADACPQAAHRGFWSEVQRSMRSGFAHLCQVLWCCNVHNELAYNDAAQGPPSQPPVPSPGGQPSHPRFRSDGSSELWSQAAFACSDQRNGCPERQTLCRITESFLAAATRALPLPDRLAMACPQSFKLEAFLSRVRITTAASYNRVRASVSPHFEILPLRSTSPD